MKKIRPKSNTIFRGDNLAIMQAIPDNSVDLIYIDPPFFTQKNYKNIWGDLESVQDYEDIKKVGFADNNDFFEQHLHSGAKGLNAYLEWMRFRFKEMHRILKPTGVFWCHIDYHACHYIKVMLDEIFGYKKFVNEIIWQRKTSCTHAQHKPKSFQNNHDTLLVYSKSNKYCFNPVYTEYEQDYIEKFNLIDENGDAYMSVTLNSPSYRPNLIYTYKGYPSPPKGWMCTKDKMKKLEDENRLIFPKNKNGRIRKKNYLKDRKGKPLANIWTDIGPVQGQSHESVGWPTQKPVALLERIISVSSNPGDMILDCFAGCGTSMHAAHILKRKWIGVDISPTAIKVNKKRLQELGAKVDIIDERELKKTYGIDARLKAA